MAKIPNFPSIDFSGLDATKLAGLDGKVVAAVRDAAYITIGFGVLALQQAQVRRREVVKTLDGRFDAFEAQLDSTVEKFEERLPEQAAMIVSQAHDLAKAARKQVRGLIRTAA